MPLTMTGVITGAAVTGLTTPTYTLTADGGTDNEKRQSAVTALGGTQAGVTIHAISSPFTITVTRPRVFKTLGKPNLNGLISNIGRNTVKKLVRKGVIPLAGQPSQINLIRTDYEVVAGSELADIANIRASVSLNEGWGFANASNIVDVLTTGII